METEHRGVECSVIYPRDAISRARFGDAKIERQVVVACEALLGQFVLIERDPEPRAGQNPSDSHDGVQNNFKGTDNVEGHGSAACG